ncbi:MFS transporter [Gordonia sp. PKS22-38]|uniref:MFS transporter n=1 Tax=Gordonia prachuapensis TaxID=3115651 RepID=A0ABU7MZ42_9ACTN|nr:MFS transporter [Gordonia sp. PKS22-38]
MGPSRDGAAESGRGRRSPRQHPGTANYPADEGRSGRPTGRGSSRGHADHAYLPPRTHNPHLPPLDGDPDDPANAPTGRMGGTRAMPSTETTDPRMPKKITVARVAAMRSRELTGRGVGKIYRAATADGADRSGMTALTLPVIANFAVDAAMAVALANTLFFAAATGESKTNVGLYLALTIAPFALIAPLIGPLLDRLQHGRRIAMATTFGLRTVLALLIMANSSWNPVTEQLEYDPWVLYPSALGLLVLSKSFGVLKSAVTPRVVPPSIDLPRVNSRLTTFGLIGGTLVGGAVAAVFELLLAQVLPFHIPGAMAWLAVIAAVGAWFCMRIPAWVEVTEGEIPTTLTYHGEPAMSRAPEHDAGGARKGARETANELAAKMRQPLGRKVVAGLWGNATIRILTGFLTLYIAFYAKAQQDVSSDWTQLLLLGAVGAAAAVGNMLGNGLGTRLELKNPPTIVLWCTAGCFVVAVLAAIFGSIVVATVAAFVASGTSAIGKVCLDSSIQDDLPDESRASAFGRSETVLQLGWVFGATLGVVLPTTLWIGFTVVAALLGVGLVQTVLTNRGSSLVPGIGGRRPDYAEPTVAFSAVGDTDRTWRRGPSASPSNAATRAHDAPTTRPASEMDAGRSTPPTRPHRTGHH